MSKKFQLDYDQNSLSKKPLQGLTFRGLPLEDVLESILHGKGVHYKFIDNKI